MISIRKELREGLTTATGLEVYFTQPPVNVDITIPLLILEEKSNRQHYRDMNGQMECVELTYDVSIYTNQPSQLFDLMESVDDYLFSIGLNRIYTSADLNMDNKLFSFLMKLIFILENKGVIIWHYYLRVQL